jgi:hypothetical protein
VLVVAAFLGVAALRRRGERRGLFGALAMVRAY